MRKAIARALRGVADRLDAPSPERPRLAGAALKTADPALEDPRHSVAEATVSVVGPGRRRKVPGEYPGPWTWSGYL